MSSSQKELYAMIVVVNRNTYNLVVVTASNCDIDMHNRFHLGQKFNKLQRRIALSWSRHDTDLISALLALYEGNPPATDGLTSQWLINTGETSYC